MQDRISRALRANDQRLLASVAHKTPTAVYPYFDKLAFWIETPFTEEEKDFIRAQCGPGGTDLDLEKGKRRARFDPRLIQRIEVRQPSPELLLFLSTVQDLFFNMAEIALDLIFETEEDRDAAYLFIDRHIVKRGHRGEVRYDQGTRYTDRRWAQTNLVAYRPEYSKLTGEIHCLHLEWRVCGIAGLRRMGINSISDMLEFDHYAHWDARLALRKFDFARLGRAYSNALLRVQTNKARKPRVYVTNGGFKYPVDRRIGQILWRCEGSTVQGVIDYARKKGITVNRCLREIDNHLLLPTKDI